jgi:hypothetical protein
MMLMQIELFGLFGISIVILFVFSETPNKAIIGVFTSLLLLLLGVWCIYDPITMMSGNTLTGIQTTVSNSTTIANYTSSTSIETKNLSTNFTYAPPANYAYTALSYSNLIGLFLVLISMFGMLHYGLRVGQDLNGR